MFIFGAQDNDAMEEYTPRPVNDCYHVYSDGTRLTVLCETEEDYVFVMNRVAVVSYYCHLGVLGLEVMRTHFHVILRGQADQVTKFALEIKRLCSRYFNKLGMRERANQWLQLQIDPIHDEDELRRKIIYVFRNCTEAGFEYLPEDYPWGSGAVYCRRNHEGAKKVGQLDYNDLCRLFRTRVKLPGLWEYDHHGMLIPGSYMDLQYLHQKVFVSPRQFIAFLNVRKKDLIEMELADAKPFMEKKDENKLRKEIEDASMNRYNRPVSALTQTQRTELASQFWNERKTLSIRQLARLTRSDPEILRAVLHIPSRT